MCMCLCLCLCWISENTGTDSQGIIHNLTRAGRDDDDESHLIILRGEPTSLSHGSGAVQPSGLGAPSSKALREAAFM